MLCGSRKGDQTCPEVFTVISGVVVSSKLCVAVFH